MTTTTTDVPALFKVGYPVTTTFASYITALNATQWIPSPTSVVNVSVVGEVSLGKNTTTSYSLDPAWWVSNTAITSWNVGVPKGQEDRPPADQTFPNYSKAVATTSPTSETSTSEGTSGAATTNSNVETASQGTSAQTSTASVTSSSAVSSATNSTLPPPKREGLSSRAAAGVGIGSAAAGAILALLLAWLLMRRKSSASKAYGGTSQLRSTPSDESPPGFDKTPAIMMSPLPPKGDTFGSLLPPPIETSELVQMFSRLGTVIQNHAYSYYNQVPKAGGLASNNNKPGTVCNVLGQRAPVDSNTILGLLSGSHRVVAVRILLGWAIISNIEPHSDSETTLLPPEFATSLRAFDQYASTDPTLLSKWRHLTGIILASTYGSETTDVKTLNRTNFTHLVDMLDEVLAPLATPSEISNRRSNLEQIIKLGASSGYILLTQPTGWRFEWHSAQVKSGKSLVVFPDLVQVEDDMGRSLDPPRSHKTMQVVNIG